MVVVLSLEERVFLVPAGEDVRNQVEDLLARELVEQALGHDRSFRGTPIVDRRLFDQRRLTLGERIDHYLDHVTGLLEDHPGDDLARVQGEDVRLEFFVDVLGRFQQRLQDVLGRLFFLVELGQVGSEDLALVVQAVAGDAVGDFEQLFADVEGSSARQRLNGRGQFGEFPLTASRVVFQQFVLQGQLGPPRDLSA